MTADAVDDGEGGRGSGGQGGQQAAGGAGGADAPVVLSDLSTAPLAQMCSKGTWGPARLWRLSRDQLRNSLKDALAVDLTAAQLASFNDGAGLLFNNDAASLRIRKADAESWQLAAKDIAAAAVPSVKTANLCATLDAACAPMVVQFAANALFRRKLNDAEQARYQKLYTLTISASGGTGEKAAQAVLNAMLLSPYFLYRSELGTPVAGKTGVARLTPNETATALAFTLWQTGPDAELLQAAAAGKLNTSDDIKAQAERMMGDARFARFYVGMLADLSRASRIASREGADDVANAGTVMNTLSEEFQNYAGGLTKNGATFAQMLTNTSLSVANDTAKFRNLGTATGATMANVTLPSGLAGLLSLGAVNFANAGTDHPSPVKRGVMVRENFLCSPVPPPPPNIKQETVPRSADVVTNRDVYEKTMAPSTCNACHRLFNPMGYAFEAFDEQGRYRTMDNGAPVKLSGEIVDTRDANGMFSDLAGLAAQLSKSSQAQECFALNGFRFVSGRIETQGDLCHVNDIHAAWMAAKGDLKTLALLLVTSDAFVTRSTSL
ncbi:MAG: DUF1588 domain-containing protein [Deltaproteobacteria bacterium]|nr:DUF1588 domain-containing protein [Deltaproteobacteria bacterium]